MVRDIWYPHTKPADSAQSRLHGSHQLRLHLILQLTAIITVRHIPADILVKQKRVRNSERIGTIAPNTHIHIQTNIVIYVPKRNRRSCAIQIVHNFLRIEEINSLVLACTAAERKSLPHGFEGIHNTVTQITAEQAGLSGLVKNKLSGLRTELHNTALFHNNHTLALVHCHNGTIGNDIICSFIIAASAVLSPFSLCHQDIIGKGITVKVFPPLVCQKGTYRILCRSDQSHNL